MNDISTILITLFLAINQSFFMGFFFMISSYFNPGSVDRKGSTAFLVDRLKRLGIPLVLFMLLIFPLTIYPVARLYGFGGALGRYLSDFYTDIRNFTFGPLWFVAMLLLFSLAYVLWRMFTKPSDPPAQSEGKAPGNAAIATFALVLGVATFIVRIWIPVGEGIPLLNLQPAHVVQYIALFIAGILAYRRNWFSGLSDAQGKFWLRIILLLIAVFPLLFVFGGALEGDFDSAFGGVHWQSFAYSVWEQFMCLAVVVTLIVWFRNRFNKQGS
ncbi:MAG: acyltransferase family protein, partial [Anaerolineales bacterium]|nr:acyltransferase family protein [Anaerolineales bacterium]